MNIAPPVRVICGTSWNGTEFIYNVQRDTWQACDDITIGCDHVADEHDLPDAENCRRAENCCFIAPIRLEEYVDSAS
jgi:hypothetical protein